MKKIQLLLCTIILCTNTFSQNHSGNTYTITDKGYFTNGKATLLIQHNNYYVGRSSGIELIQHGERILTNGGLAMTPCAIPDAMGVPIPQKGKRDIDYANNQINTYNTYPKLDIPYEIEIRNIGKNFIITLLLNTPINDTLSGKLDFIIELYPETYKGKNYFMDNHSGIFPNQFNSDITTNKGISTITPLAVGHHLAIAPSSNRYALTITSEKNQLELIDARGIHEHKWFVVRTSVPTGKTGKVIEWTLTPKTDENWERTPRIAYSQIGYHPQQNKKAFVELDSTTKHYKTIELYKLQSDGKRKKTPIPPTQKWGRYLCYDYLTIDFSNIKEEGLYQLVYDTIETQPFPIKKNTYADVWKPTIETFLCVQMCHMNVKDRIRNWHGICHDDDAIIPPNNQPYLLGYTQSDTSDVPFAPGQHIPGVNVGGWHDAGDNQVPLGVTSHAVHTLSLAVEEFNPNFDQTTINQKQKQTYLHTPDGENDLLQLIEHGLLNMLAGYRIAGHAFIGTICSTWEENLEIGSPGDNNDGIIGTPDDRFIFTSKSQPAEYNSAATFAAAYRILKNNNPTLANECLITAETIWDTENGQQGKKTRGAYAPYNTETERINAAVELYLATRQEKYRTFLLQTLETYTGKITVSLAAALCRAAQELQSETFETTLKERLTEWKKQQFPQFEDNPFRLPPLHTMFGSLAYKLGFAANYYYLHTTFPDIFEPDFLYRTLHYTFGCHAVPDRTFVSGVGIRSLTPGFGFNRSDYSYIPGGVTCGGTGWIQPDFPEFKENDPYLWLQTEYTVGASVDYVFCALAAEKILQNQSK